MVWFSDRIILTLWRATWPSIFTQGNVFISPGGISAKKRKEHLSLAGLGSGLCACSEVTMGVMGHRTVSAHPLIHGNVRQ
jgi:hypothetical protein